MDRVPCRPLLRGTSNTRVGIRSIHPSFRRECPKLHRRTLVNQPESGGTSIAWPGPFGIAHLPNSLRKIQYLGLKICTRPAYTFCLSIARVCFLRVSQAGCIGQVARTPPPPGQSVRFGHVFILVEENANYSDIKRRDGAPVTPMLQDGNIELSWE